MATNARHKHNLPVLLMAYNRPLTITRQFERLEKEHPREIHVYIDGAKQNDVQTQSQVVQATSKWAENTRHRPYIHIGSRNLGIRDHFPFAAKRFFSQHLTGIILEDDIAFSPDFFSFCERSLQLSDNKNFWSVCGHNPTPKSSTIIGNSNASFLTNIHTIWGWATVSQSIEQFLKYRTYPVKRVFEDIEVACRGFTKDPFLQKAIELVWKRKYSRSVSKEGGGSWDNSWELAAWNSKFPSIMPIYSLSKEVIANSESGTHNTVRENYSADNFLKLQHSSKLYPLKKSRDISLMQIWGLKRSYAWAYSMRIRKQLNNLSLS